MRAFENAVARNKCRDQMVLEKRSRAIARMSLSDRLCVMVCVSVWFVSRFGPDILTLSIHRKLSMLMPHVSVHFHVCMVEDTASHAHPHNSRWSACTRRAWMECVHCFRTGHSRSVIARVRPLKSEYLVWPCWSLWCQVVWFDLVPWLQVLAVDSAAVQPAEQNFQSKKNYPNQRRPA